ncbi:MAG TPA: hypothetical protein VIV59_13555, partial [Anaeromyxobacteraceae bacterium]
MDGVKLELAAEAVHSRWADPTPGTTLASVGFGTASNLPQLVGRVKFEGKAGDLSWMAYLAGSYESVNLKGFGSINPNGITLLDGSVKTSISPYVGEVGGLFKFNPVSLALNVYTGKGTGPMAGSLLQMGDIGDTGYWVQLGVNATSEFSIWGLYGADAINKTDLAKWVPATAAGAPKSDNQLFGGQLRYQEGGYAFAAEYYRYSTKYLAVAGANNYPQTTTNAMQLLLTGAYFF